MTPVSRPLNIVLTAGARPNFMKLAPLWKLLRRDPRRFAPRMIHTGQHYDPEMSGYFFRDLGLPKPDHFLGAGPGSAAEQTARIMVAFENICLHEKIDLVVVFGDANSTLACAVTAKKLAFPVAHVEAGLRSRDWTMPEETNRIVTDSLSDFLFTPSKEADENLLREGVPPHRIHFVGNIMIDALKAARPKALKRRAFHRLALKPGKFGIVTLHRPSNVDDPQTLEDILRALGKLKGLIPLVFPIHPRTHRNIRLFGLSSALESSGLLVTEPQGYLDFLNLECHARLVITDSGGIQEETTWLGIPCLTLRRNTERPVTIRDGTNRLALPGELPGLVHSVLNGSWPNGRIPELWDGRTAERIVSVLSGL